MSRERVVGVAYEVGRGATLAFMVLLVAAAVYLAAGREGAANLLAEYAYYSLVLAVASLLVAVALEPGEEGGEGGGGGSGSAGGGVGFGFSSLLRRLPRLPSVLRGRFSLVLRVVYVCLVVAVGLRVAVLLGLGVVPGRPTYTPGLQAFSGVSGWVLAVVGAASSILGVLARSWLLVGGGLAGVVGGVAGGWVGVAAGLAAVAAASMAAGGFGLLLWAAVAVGFSGSLLALAGYLSSSLPLEALGWAVLLLAVIAGFIVGFSASIAATLSPSGLREREGGGTSGGSEGEGGGWWGLLLLAVAAVVGVVAVFAPRLVKGEGVYSLDTLYNLRFCRRLAAGDYSVFLSWRRPLYTLAATGLGVLMGCPYSLYDIAIPLTGYLLLAATVYIVARRDGLSSFWAGYTSLLSMLFWVPFFSYAGLQTNLLALPLALLLARETLHRLGRSGGGNGGRGWLLYAGWLVLGLWHPWTLAFYTVALLLAGLQLWGWRLGRLLSLALYTLPGWAGYGVVELLARGFSVGNVARSVFVLHYNYVETLKIFFWGTSIRGELVLPVAVALAGAALGRLGLPRRWAWILGPTLAAFLLSPFPNARLIPRYLVDSTIPLLAAYTLNAIGGGRRRLLLALILLASTATTFALFLAHTLPVTGPPHAR